MDRQCALIAAAVVRGSDFSAVSVAARCRSLVRGRSRSVNVRSSFSSLIRETIRGPRVHGD